MKNIKKQRALSFALLALLLAFALLFSGCDGFLSGDTGGGANDGTPTVQSEPIDVTLYGSSFTIPAYTDSPYTPINNNIPFFTEDEIVTECFEHYSPLDSLGRCGVVSACCGKATMPPEGDERGSISHVKPSGWVQGEYDSKLVDGRWLYNRSHLIGWQLTDEDDNAKNLITGTRYFNVEGMLRFENMVADYIRETGNLVMYRVTPVYIGDNLVANGVLMEAYSVHDGGEDLSFCVFCYNVQPGVLIDYKTGANMLDNGYNAFPEEEEKGDGGTQDSADETYILNTSSKKIHKPSCSSVADMSEANKSEHKGSIDGLLDDGYTTCGSCFR